MTSFAKLQISGIRSYAPANPQVISFQKPLTIIVGANGSGKTVRSSNLDVPRLNVCCVQTIIEALKFVCTGSQPPLSDTGKAFVHDPKVWCAM